MYITINDIIGKKRINLSYPIKGKEITVVSMLSDNVQYWLHRRRSEFESGGLTGM